VAPVAVELLATLPLVVPYDHLGGAVVLVGLFLTVSADGLLAARTAPAAYKQALRASLGLEGGVVTTTTAAAAPDDNAAEKGSPETKAKAVDEEATVAAAEEEAAPPHHLPHHHHVCSRSLAEQRLMAALTLNNNENDTCGLPLVRERRAAALAYSLEVGCVLHSFLIGLAVGVSAAAGRSTVAALTTAVALHQAIEGLALGCALGRAPFSKLHAVMMSLVYSLTTPTGVAIGIGVAGTFDPESVAAAAATGVASGLSAGLLLYLGLCQLMMEELSKEDLIVRRGLRWAVHGAVMLGGGLMCVLALWA
jgi:zinc transporter 1/2/3